MSDEIIQQNIFKAYDIRGVVDTELTDEVVYKIGQAVGSDAANKKQKTI
jgi:phosphomannomutase/phosphoglucomutase